MTGEVAAVVGGAGAIGSAIVRKLADAGVRVFCLDMTRLDGIESLACDVRDEASVAAGVGAIESAAGKLDLLVYAAGVSREAVIWKMAVDEWDRIHSVNLRGAFLVLRAAVPLMRKGGGGRIALIGSINGSRGKRGTSAYSASKAGLIGLAKSVARETGRFGITVNVVEPGWVETPMTQSLPAEIRDAARGETAGGEFVEPADVAALVEFLVSPAARRITGHVFRVDAGQFTGD